MTTNAARHVNFDSFPTNTQPPAGRPAADPLAELARIVGQDDPFRALLEARGGPAPQPQAAPAVEAPVVVPQAAHPTYREPSFAAAAEAPALRGPIDAAPEPAPVDAFDRYLAEVESRGAHAADPEAELPPGPSAPPRSRRLLVSVGAALGVVTVAVAGGLTWKNMRAHPVGTDGAPLVMADKAPLKVVPQNAGGVEIPGQDKQIYERGTKDKPTRVVNREEQPVDVAQVARQAAARDAGPGSSGTNALQDSLGEPRRVRTVAVRPEMPERPASPPQAATATPSPVPTMTMPTATAPTVQPARPPKPTPDPATTAAAAPRIPAPVPVAAAPIPVPAPAPKPQRVASAAPEAAAPVETAPAPAGGFAVQLAVRPSDKEARVAFKEIQQRYSAQLGGRAPIIRQAEVSGRTVYRIRVGASTLEDANALCGKLKTAGGQCFVAKN